MGQNIAALLIDDDARFAALVSEYLGGNDVRVTHAQNGERGLATLLSDTFDVVLLDIMMPGIDGLELCRRIRGNPATQKMPVIMLTAKGDDVEKVIGLELGADDYLAKPFNPRELLARVRALVRRAQGLVPSASEEERFRSGDLEIDFSAREVLVSGRRQILTHFEFELLQTLALAAGRVLSRDHLLDRLKGIEFDVFDRSIDVHVSRLRAKIESDPKMPRHIKTVRGVGYMLVKMPPGE